MATFTFAVDTLFSSIGAAEGDTVNMRDGAILTVDASTPALQQWTVTLWGAIHVVNPSTTTPIFIRSRSQTGASGRIRIENDSTVDIQGGLIELGTSNGTANQSFVLPTDAAGDTYQQLGGLWVDHGDLYNDGTPFNRSWTRADTFADCYGDDRFGLVFTHDEATNTITFGDGTEGHIPPAGAKIYIPNIQWQKTGTPGLSNIWDFLKGGSIIGEGCAFSRDQYSNYSGAYKIDIKHFCYDAFLTSLPFQQCQSLVKVDSVAANSALSVSFNNNNLGVFSRNVNFRCTSNTSLTVGFNIRGLEDSYFEFMTCVQPGFTQGSTSRGAFFLSCRNTEFRDFAAASASIPFYVLDTQNSVMSGATASANGSRAAVGTANNYTFRCNYTDRFRVENYTDLPPAQGGVANRFGFLLSAVGARFIQMRNLTIDGGNRRRYLVNDSALNTLLADVTMTGQWASRGVNIATGSYGLSVYNAKFTDVQANTQAAELGDGCEYQNFMTKGITNGTEGGGEDAPSHLVIPTEDDTTGELLLRFSPNLLGSHYTENVITGPQTTYRDNRLYMHNVGDQVEIEGRVHGGILGFTAIRNTGTINQHYDVELSMRRPLGTYTAWMPFSLANAQAQLASLPADADNRIQCRWRNTKNTFSTNAFLNRLELTCTLDPAYQAPYLFNPVQVLFQNIKPGSEIIVLTAPGGNDPAGVELFRSAVAGTTAQFDYSYLGDQPITGWIRKGSSPTFYKQWDINATIGDNGRTIFVDQQLDE